MPSGVFERSDEHRRHISEALKGKPKSEEHRRNAAQSRVGTKRSLESRLKGALANTGKKHPWTAEQKAALSAARKGARSYALRSRHGISFEEQERQRDAGNKWCCEHKGYSPAGEFAGKRTYCKTCAPAFNRRALLRGDFKIDSAWYERTLAEQGGGCAICGSTKTRPDQKFQPIDHNHKTGALRGILCNRCNAFLGMLEAPALHEKALAYLAHHSQPSEGGVDAQLRPDQQPSALPDEHGSVRA